MKENKENYTWCTHAVVSVMQSFDKTTGFYRNAIASMHDFIGRIKFTSPLKRSQNRAIDESRIKLFSAILHENVMKVYLNLNRHYPTLYMQRG
jgi:hypothetical protein